MFVAQFSFSFASGFREWISSEESPHKDKEVRGCVWVSVSPSYLSTHSPCSEHMAAEVELARLHLVIAGAAVIWNVADFWRTFEHFHVMHDGLVTWSYHWLILTGTEREKERRNKWKKRENRVVLCAFTGKSFDNTAHSDRYVNINIS